MDLKTSILDNCNETHISVLTLLWDIIKEYEISEKWELLSEDFWEKTWLKDSFYNRALELAPNDVNVLQTIWWEINLKLAHSIEPGSFEILEKLLYCLDLNLNSEEAASYIEKLQTLAITDEQKSIVNYMYWRLSEVRWELENAIEYFNQAIKHKHCNADSLYFKIWELYLQIWNPNKAIESYGKSRSKNRFHTIWQIYLDIMWDWENALKYFNLAIENRRELYVSEDDLDRARALIADQKS